MERHPESMLYPAMAEKLVEMRVERDAALAKLERVREWAKDIQHEIPHRCDREVLAILDEPT